MTNLKEAFQELTESRKERFISSGRVWQLIDDALDSWEDYEEQTKNLFLGMATNAWYDKGQPQGEDIDYFRNHTGSWPRGLLSYTRFQELAAIKSSRMRSTRARYKQKILDELPLIGGNSAKMFSLTAQLVF